jgi:hypothetical protein
MRWTFGREQLIWGINTNYTFNKIKHRQLFIRAGTKSRDINNEGGINQFINSLTSLLLKKNYLKLYESKYLSRATPAR